MSRWAERDAQRLARRIRHLAVEQHRQPGGDELVYMRRLALLLLTDDVELPEFWRAYLRELDSILVAVQRKREAVA